MKRAGRFAFIAIAMGLAQGLTGVELRNAQAGECDHAAGSKCQCTSSNYGLLDALDQVADSVLKDASKQPSVLSLLSRRSASGCTGGPGCDCGGHQVGKTKCDCGACCDARQSQSAGQNSTGSGVPSSGTPSRLRQVPVHKNPNPAVPSQQMNKPPVPGQPERLPQSYPPATHPGNPSAIPTPLPSDATTDPFLDESARFYRPQANMHAVAAADPRAGVKHYSAYRQINPQTGVVPARRRITSLDSGAGQFADTVVMSDFSSRRPATATHPAAASQVITAAVHESMPMGGRVITSSASEPPRLPVTNGPVARPIININPDEVSSRNPLRKR